MEAALCYSYKSCLKTGDSNNPSMVGLLEGVNQRQAEIKSNI